VSDVVVVTDESSVVVENTTTTYVVENVGVVGTAAVSLTAPVSPQNGDLWAVGSVLKVHLGGVTYNVDITPA
jgi:hypothetical protein